MTQPAPASSATSILDVRDLAVTFSTPDGPVEAVKGLSFSVSPGKCVGLVGESGSGKSQTVLAVMGLTPSNGRVDGQCLFEGRDIAHLKRAELNAVRGRRIGRSGSASPRPAGGCISSRTSCRAACASG